MRIKTLNIALIISLMLILVSSVAQSAWRKNTNMPIDYQNVTYLDIMFLKSNPNFGWACGYDAKIIRTTDAGKTWKGARLYRNGSPIFAQLESINFVNEKVGYTSGPELEGFGYGIIYKTTDGGASWFDITPRNVTDLWGNYFLDENFGVVIGGGCDSYQYFWRTTNGGTSWESLIYSQSGSKMADALLYSKNGLGYAIGSGWLWKTTNGGASWIPFQSTGKIDWHEEITNINKTFLIPVSDGCYGNTATNIGGVKISHDEGKNWSYYNTAVPMFGTFLLDENNGWAVGFNRTAIRTSDGGKTWISDNCGIDPSDNLDDVWFINDTTGWAAGTGVYEYFIPDGTPPVIVSSSNGFYICPGDTITLSASMGYDAYIWSTGENAREIKVSSAGKYSVRGIIDSICYDGLSQEVEVKFYNTVNPKFVLSSNTMPCEGDTIILSLEDKYLDYEWSNGEKTEFIELNKNSSISVKLIDTNGCKVLGSIDIVFYPKPNPKIHSKGRLNICIGDSVELFTDGNYIEYKWYDLSKNDVISTQKKLYVSSSGEYYLVVKNQNHCVGVSDTLSIIVRNETNVLEFQLDNSENIFDFDSTFFTQLNCKMLKISNKSEKDIVLDDIYFFRNLVFSSPQSQFPFLVKAKSDNYLKICFSPDKLGLDYDTLLVSDICSDHLIKLMGLGIVEQFRNNSKCDVPLIMKLTTYKKQAISLGIGQIYPNPVSSEFKINFSVNTHDFSDFEKNFNLKIINSIGQVQNLNPIMLINPISENLINGEIIFNSNELLSGLYVIAFEIYGKVISEKFTIVK